MSNTDTAQVVSTGFAAISAIAALLTVRHTRAETKLARDAFEAQTQPLLTDVPRGVMKDEIDWHEASGQMSRRLVDKSEIGVGTIGPEPIAFASVPVRNVGNGCAHIRGVKFTLEDGAEASGRIDNPVLPPGELTQASLSRAPDEEGSAVAESIGLEYKDFSIVIDYGDASGRPRDTVRLEIANGQYPHVRTRCWASGVRDG